MGARRDAIGRFVVRLGAMASKEVLHLRRDPRNLALGLGMPLVLLLLFGHGVSFDLDRVPLAVSDEDLSPESSELAGAFLGTGAFQAVPGRGEDAQGLFARGEALAVLVVPRGYAGSLARGESAGAQLLVDGADAVTARVVLVKAEEIARAVSQRLAPRGRGAAAPPIEVKVSTLYNPEGRSALHFVPGLAAYLVAIGAVLLTALTVAGEWERGSMEQLFASPAGRAEIVLGKLLPYLGLGMLQLCLLTGVGATVFHVPVLGSPLLIFAAGLLFLLCMLGQGLLISVASKNQLLATQAGALSSLLPSLLFSGMIFPIESMPAPLRALSWLVPARYLVHSLRGVMLKGSGISVLWPDLLALAAFGAVVAGLAGARLDRRVA